MNQAHIHLLITHLPIFGSILGGLVLVHGIWTKSNHTMVAAYNLFILSAIGAGIAYLTGEGAEEAVENIQGIAEATIEKHEDFALFALISLIMLGIASLLGLLVTYSKSIMTRTVAFVVLFIALISFVLVARTGYLGGQIRHTEVHSNNQLNTTPQETEGDHD